MKMTEAHVADFCLSLPGAREDYKWGGVRVFSIAGNKMFALQNLRGDSLAFKVDKELFLGHVDRPGIHPAPYLARAQWIIMPWRPPSRSSRTARSPGSAGRTQCGTRQTPHNCGWR